MASPLKTNPMATSTAFTETLVFVCVEPQLPENIGAVARAMANFGIHTLRLVAPKCDPNHDTAHALAAGAGAILENATTFTTWEDAVADCHVVYGTCAYHRHMIQNIIPLPEAATHIHQHITQHQKVAILFGGERNGLPNEILAQCRGIITIPVDPQFASINLAQAAILVGYALHTSHIPTAPCVHLGRTMWATQEDLMHFFNRLEAMLDTVNYWRVAEKKPLMWRNLKSIFSRYPLTAQDLQTLLGVFRRLYDHKKPPHIL